MVALDHVTTIFRYILYHTVVFLIDLLQVNTVLFPMMQVNCSLLIFILKHIFF
jgi:hypothetical protein